MRHDRHCVCTRSLTSRDEESVAPFQCYYVILIVDNSPPLHSQKLFRFLSPPMVPRHASQHFFLISYTHYGYQFSSQSPPSAFSHFIVASRPIVVASVFSKEGSKLSRLSSVTQSSTLSCESSYTRIRATYLPHPQIACLQLFSPSRSFLFNTQYVP